MCAKILRREPPDQDPQLPDGYLTDEQPPKIEELHEEAAETSKPRDSEFDKLVESALDFLNRGLREVKTDPKYSVIDFFTGVELMLKARLLHEHWSLVVAKPGEISKQKFLEGNFESATRKQCFARLENVCGEVLKQEQICFDQLAEHRNRVVHFYHSAYSGTPDQQLLESIVIQQLRAGAYLMRLLRHRWSEEFSGYASEMADLERSLRDHRHYLNEKLDLVAPQLRELESNGGLIWVCTFCGMKAAEVTECAAPLKTSHCLVCDWSRSHIYADCPECKEGKIEFDVGTGTCDECEAELNLDFLLEKYAPDGAVAYCPECSYSEEESVIPHGDEYLCLACGTTYDRVGECEFCNERVAGDLEGSYAFGCMFCDGKIGWDSDD